MPSGITWSRSAFVWEDGSTRPTADPSGQAYEGAGYSHWGVTTSGRDAQPNNAGDQRCTASFSTNHAVFAYYSGPATSTGRRTLANYVQEADASLNLWSWNDQACTVSYAYICEFDGAHGSWLMRQARHASPRACMPRLYTASCRLACGQAAQHAAPQHCDKTYSTAMG
jgi:hypothetical protein